eukprot:UN06283
MRNSEYRGSSIVVDNNKHFYSTGTLYMQFEENLIITTSRGIQLDPLTLQTTTSSVDATDCKITQVPGPFITENYDCNFVQDAGTSFSGSHKYLAQCLIPHNLYQPLQQSYTQKWCTVIQSTKRSK